MRRSAGRMSTQMDRVKGIQTGSPPGAPAGSISSKIEPPKSCQPVTVPAGAPVRRSNTAEPTRSDR
ncbi:MAG: hypothetical protein KatS3mg004_1211 [Bryobacteraceae bacterium]|nr:MAG: hypothetical protein KatS3mg004_1211 [Bryobacteraceae bacterium]